MSCSISPIKHPILNYIKHIQRYLYIYCIIIKFLFLCISMFITEISYPVFSSYFEENTLIHHPNTGQKYQFHISSVSYEYGKRTIKYKGIKLWNNFPVNSKETKWLQSFKHKIQEFIHRSVTLWPDLIICICINWLYFVYECMFNRFIYIGLLIYMMTPGIVMLCLFFTYFALLCLFVFHYPYCYVDIGGQHWCSRYSL